MRVKEQLHALIDRLDDEDAESLLAMAADLAQSPRRPAGFVGLFHSGKGDLAERSEDILRTEYGSRPA